ncbi:MAG: alpha/beta fold hydrolase [Rhodothermales bacterium]
MRFFLVLCLATATNVFAQADLSLSVSGVPADEIRGGNFTAQYEVHNAGPQDTNGNVVVTIALDNASIQSLNGGVGGTVNQTDAQNATVTYPSFPFGLTVTNDVIIVTNGSGGDATVTISVATGNDSNTTNNAFTATVTVPTRPEGDLNGTVYKDVNKNGEVDDGDTPIEGVQISLNTGTSRTTNAEGYFEWIDLFRRPYDVTVGLPEGFTQVIPETNPFTVDVVDGGVTTVVILLNDENEVVPGRVSGILTIDRTGNGNPVPMEGIRVYDDGNDNGVFEQAETSTLTDAEGVFDFENLTPGTVFRVRADVPAYAVPVDPSPAREDVAIGPGTNAAVFYTYRFSGSVAGFVYVDNNADGMYTDGVDDRLPLDEDDLELLDTHGVVEGAQNTGDLLVGEFLFGGLYPGEYIVPISPPDGWERSEFPGAMVVSEANPFPDEYRLGTYERVNIRADAFYDLNENGVRDTGEPPAPGIGVTCVSSGDCQGMTDESDAQGVISFFQVQPGTFTLNLTAPEGPGQFVAPANGQFQFTLKSGQDNVEMMVAVKEPVNGVPIPDILVAPSAQPANPAPGDDVQLEVLVVNRGTGEALEVNSTHRLVALDYVSHTTSQGGCDFDTQANTIRCTHGLMDAGDTTRVAISARASVAGPAAVDASAVTSSVESNELNNRVVLDVVVSATELTMVLQDEEELTCTPDWGLMAGGRTSEGNDVRLRVRVVNSHPDRDETVRVALEGLASQVSLPEQTVVVPAQDLVVVEFRFSTEGWAWNADGTPREEAYPAVFRLRRGEELMSELEYPLTVLPKPLVLVHGLWSNAATWDAWPAYATAAHPGWDGRVFAVNTMDTGTITFAGKRLAAATFTRTTIAQNAEAMDAFIANVRNETGSCHIDIVGHSMGGLISRKFIHEHMPELETDGRPLTDKLIMLGTPNQGSPCVEPAMALYVHAQYEQLRNPPTDPADRLTFPPNNIIELDRDVMGRFNDRVSNKKGVTFDVLAGATIPTTCQVTNPGDLLVERRSAFALDRPTIVDAETVWDITHISMTSDEPLFTEFVLPRLKPSGGSQEPVSTVAAASSAAASSTDAGVSEVYTVNHDVASGDAVFEVGSFEAMSVVLFVPDHVTTQLLDPIGAVVWEVLAESDAANAYFRSATVESPEVGTWRLTFASSEPLTDASASFSVYARNPSFAVEATFGEPVADIVPVLATVTVDGMPGSAVVEAEAVGETITTRPLFDDGAHGDGLAGDGIYGGQVAVGAAGTAIVAVRATRDGETRRVQSIVEVVTVTDTEPAGAEIPSEFRMANIYPNPMSGNGMLEVHLPSETSVSVRLFDTLGRQVERVADTHLAAGVHRIPVDVRAAAGVYLLVVETRSGRSHRQIVITR